MAPRKRKNERPAKRPAKLDPAQDDMDAAAQLLGPALRLSVEGQLRVAENMARAREWLAARRLTNLIKTKQKGHPNEDIDDCEF